MNKFAPKLLLLPKVLFILFIVIINLRSVNSYSQYITPVEFNSGGNESISGDITLSSSIGGFAVTTFINDTIYLTQGYQQVDSLSTIVKGIDNKVIIKAFPNPCTRFISIKLTNLEFSKTCTVEIFSSMGKASKIYSNVALENEVPIKIKVSDFDSGLYVIKITEKGSNKPVGQIKILKLTESK